MARATPDEFIVQDGQTFLFQGDSLTDTGRRDANAPYGWGYARMVIDLVTARYPDRRIEWINRGISGDTTDDLVARWDEDCIALEPDWVSLLIGINDLCRWFNPGHENHVPPERYRENYERLLARVRDETGARLLLLDPYFICAEAEPESDPAKVLAMLPDYIAVVREMADQFDALHVPLHDVFAEQLRHRPAEWFCPEPVHPNPAGHMVIAHAWLDAAGW